MKNRLLWLIRILVGGLFIFSGLIKANDPVGFAIKLDEYFELFAKAGSAFSFFASDWLLNSTTILASFICVLEVALGVCLLIGLWGRLVAWLLLLMMLFFTWLTGYSAITGSVTDCGCFGDAIPLTPWQSFYKDIVLTILILYIFALRKHIQPIVHKVVAFGFFFAATAFTIWICTHVLQHDVFKDFRPYAIGKNIGEQMVIPADSKKSEVNMKYTYENTSSGEKKEFIVIAGVQENLIQEMKQYVETDSEYQKLKKEYDEIAAKNKKAMDELTIYTSDKNWKFIERKDEIIKQGFMPKISDFAVIDEQENDITDKILGEEDYMFMMVSSDLTKSSPAAWEKINALQMQAEKEGIFTFGFASNSREQIEAFRHEHNTAFPFYKGDYKVCLTIIRTNPGVLLLKKGTVIDKWAWKDVPDFSKIKQMHFASRAATEISFGKEEPTELFAEGDDILTRINAGEEPYHNFVLMDKDGNDFSQQILNDSLPVYIFISADMTKVTQESYQAMLPLMQKLEEKKALWIVVSISDLKLVQQMADAAKLPMRIYNTDSDLLSGIMPENTGLLILQHGVVQKKYHETSMPTVEQLK